MLSVLIVDDQVQIRRLIRDTLEGAGYHVEAACGGKEGLARYHKQSADLVLMDILMPDQDGLEAITALRRKFPDARIIART
jgi:CheY-like chemotaxis protein